MNPLSRLAQKWNELSAEERRRIGVGLAVFLLSVTVFVALRLTFQSLNGNAFQLMLELFPKSAERPISIGPENRSEIASLRKRVKALAPQSPDLQKAKEHLLSALGHLYAELEAEGTFARKAQNRQYEEAETLSVKMEKNRKLYASELRKAKFYMEKFSRETGRPAINVQLPE
jgi:hypothetical protein